MATTRQPTGIDLLANQYFANQVALSPIYATEVGAPGFEAELDDFSPDAEQERVDQSRQALADLDKITAQDQTDQVTAAALRERLGLAIELYRAGEPWRQLNNLASPIQHVRDVFDLMPQQTEEDWAVIARRLAAVPASLGSYQAALELGLRLARLPAARQIKVGIDQSEAAAGPASSLAKLAEQG
ncbi:MAG: DUF885 domain-containing protein, partial [Micrococcales bacterium]|nr:DUF885 domain-containing protein [Micrococcales bacterium]